MTFPLNWKWKNLPLSVGRLVNPDFFLYLSPKTYFDMKRIFIIVITTACFSTLTQAQNTSPVSASTTDAKVQPSKEDKAAMKARQEADLNDALKQAGLTADQVKEVKATLDESGKKSMELKNNSTLTDVEKEAARKNLMDEKNASL